MAADGKVTIQAVIDDKEFEKSLNKLENSVAKSASSMSDKLSSISSASGNLAKSLAPASIALTALGTASFNAAANMQDAMGATEQVFGDSARIVMEWAGNLETYYGVSERAALEYSNTMGAMLKNIGGLTEKEAARQSASLIELAGDLSAMFGGSVQDAVHALTGALKGNNTMLDNYGMGVNDATIKQKAMEMGLISIGQELSLSAKQAATLALIYEQSGSALGQAAREADGASGSMRAFQAAIDNLAVSFGENLLPVITPVINALTSMVKWFGQLDPGVKNAILTFAGLTVGITVVAGVISKLSGLMSGFIGWFSMLGIEGEKASSTMKSVGSAGQAASGGIDSSGKSAGDSAIKMIAFGAAVALVAAGIAVVVLSTTELIKTFDNATKSTAELAIAAGAILLVIGVVVAGIVALGAASTATAPGLIALGGAVALVGVGIAAIEFGIAAIINALSGFVDSIDRAFSGIVDSLSRVPTVIDELGNSSKNAADEIFTVRDAIQDIISPGEKLTKVIWGLVDAINSIDSSRLYDAMNASSSIRYMRGYATGTASAASGLTLVGERGPELINLSGGERIYNAHQSSAIRSIGTNNTNIRNTTVNFSIPADQVDSFVRLVNMAEDESTQIRMGASAYAY